MMKNEIIEYAKNIGASDDIIQWINQRVEDKCNVSECEHIIDYLMSDKAPKKLVHATYKEMKSNCDKWTKSLIRKGKNIVETSKDTETIKDFGDGYKMVKLISKRSYEREGTLMRHCVSEYYGKDDEIYSLRDKNNMPHCTISKNSQQIKGKGNGSIHPKYVDYVVKFLECLNIDVRDSEMKNLGYYNIEKFVDELHENTVKQLYKKKYHYKFNELLDKNKKVFATLDLFNIIPLIENDKINYDLKKFISNLKELEISTGGNLASSGYSSKLASSGESSNLASSGESSKLASSGNSSNLASSGNYSKLASSGNYSKLASSGDESKLASSGNSSNLASSGNYSKLVSSGYSSNLASSGNYSKLVSSGYSSKLASSGYSSKLVSSGDYSKLASNGNYSNLASSGNYSKLASSGDDSNLAIKGKNSVAANIGIDGRIKGVVGTWITLAEYDANAKCLCVKSAMVDGKKLKENVWYKLENKKFVEILND